MTSLLSQPILPVRKLGQLLTGIAAIEPAVDRDIRGLALDSRRVEPGGLFLACAGNRVHGIDYIKEAIARGAVAVAYEPVDRDVIAPEVAAGPALIPIPGLQQRAGVIAARFFGQPSHALMVIGITGTNGKTSCSQFLAQALNRSAPCGVIGTLGSGLYGRLADTGHTTPDAVNLQWQLSEIRAQGAAAVVMEVSSHGLEQGRVNGIAFNGAVFTNLTHEHLDYHGDMITYAATKQRLFEVPGLHFAVVNLDDPFGRRLLATLGDGVTVVGYTLGQQPAIGSMARVHGQITQLDNDGFTLEVMTPWGSGQVRTRLLGRFNASNLLAVLSTLLVSGIEFGDAIERLAETASVPGRMERFGGHPGQPLVIVDYAHTPDALEQVLISLREHCRGVLWCVFGCGGNRDRNKRPVMGRVAEQYADRVVLTDDNPRTEDPNAIIAQIRAGMRDAANAIVERRRPQAIASAVRQASAGDVVLVAGKGHEEYQLVGDRRIPYSDRREVSALFDEAA